MGNVYKPGLLQMRPQYTTSESDADHVENILWFASASTTTPTLAQLVSIADLFDNNWGPLFATYAPSSASYMGSIITDWSSDLGLSYSTVGSYTPQPGLNGSKPAPLQVSALISYSIPKRYRGGHPRTYLPYVADEVLTGSDNSNITTTITEGIAGDLNTMVSAMKASGILGGQTQVIYLHRNDPVNAAVYEYSSFTVQSLVATQRRRLRKVAHK
jgi:hypothetical protein